MELVVLFFLLLIFPRYALTKRVYAMHAHSPRLKRLRFLVGHSDCVFQGLDYVLNPAKRTSRSRKMYIPSRIRTRNCPTNTEIFSQRMWDGFGLVLDGWMRWMAGRRGSRWKSSYSSHWLRVYCVVLYPDLGRGRGNGSNGRCHTTSRHVLAWKSM